MLRKWTVAASELAVTGVLILVSYRGLLNSQMKEEFPYPFLLLTFAVVLVGIAFYGHTYVYIPIVDFHTYVQRFNNRQQISAVAVSLLLTAVTYPLYLVASTAFERELAAQASMCTMSVALMKAVSILMIAIERRKNPG